jgi:hypothetical protein
VKPVSIVPEGTAKRKLSTQENSSYRKVKKV